MFLKMVKHPHIRFSRKSSLLILLLLAGDVEVLPGPDMNPIDHFTKSNGIKIMHQNIRGLLNQKDNLEAIITEKDSFDIFTLSETHIIENHHQDNDNLYKLEGYRFLKRNRPVGKGGGEAVYITDKLKFVIREDLEMKGIECLWLEIILEKAKNFLVGVIYRPPDNSLYTNKDFNQDLNLMLSNVNKCSLETIILGDLNVNFLVKNDHKDIKNIFNVQSFDQIIQKPTRVTENTSSLIDVVFTNQPKQISNQDVFALSLSDHDCVGCIRKVNNARYEPKTITCRNYSNYNPANLCNKLEEVDWFDFYNSRCPNKAWQLMKDILYKSFAEEAPFIRKRVKGRYCPWLTADIKIHMNERDQLLRKARRSKREYDWNLYKRKKNFCTSLVKKTKDSYHRNLLLENKNNPAKFWQNIKHVFPNTCSNKDSVYAPSIDGSENNPQAKADSFCKFFANIAENLKIDTYPLMNFKWSPNAIIPSRTKNVFKFNYVSKVFIEKELLMLKSKKSAGIDDLPPRLLKDTAKVISKPLCVLVNLSLKTGIVPSEWKIPKTSPLHKKEDLTSANNYRPISILPILSKILEKAVHNQLTSYLEENKLLSSRQFGFRKRHSTELATALLIDDMRKDVDCGKLVGAVFIDLSKAFDVLGHSLLLDKLRSYGIQSTEYKWFTDYLFCRKQICCYNGAKSCPQALNVGVPQGSILGPVLFLLYFNDFNECLKHSNIIQFADDTVIYVSSECFFTIERSLNQDLIEISNYFRKNHLIMNLNKGKTKSMLIGTAKKLSKCNDELKLQYNSRNISSTNQYKYLGSKMNTTLNMNDHFNSVYKQSCNKLSILSKMSKRMTSDSLQMIYTSMIIPPLLYSSINNLGICETQKEKLKSLQRRAEMLIGVSQANIYDLIKFHSILLVKKCLNGMVCDEFKEYFKIKTHSKTTRNNGYMLCIPKVKLQFAKSGFFSMGVKIYNSLPVEIRQTDCLIDFRNKSREHFELNVYQ